MSWRTSDGVAQEAKFITSHVLSGKNPTKWRLRLDAYLPLLQSIEIYEPPAKKSRGSSGMKQQTRCVVKPAMILDNVIGIITISVRKQSGENVDYGTSPYRIESGRVKVEDKVFRVSKELLAVQSWHYCRLFYGEFKEMKVFSLPDLTRSSLSSILHIISTPGSTPQSVDVACELVNIANRWHILGVITKCSKYLQSVKLNEKDASVLLQPANDYDLSDLLKHVLASFTSHSSLKDAFSQVAETISPETAVTIVTHLSNMVTMIGNNAIKEVKVYFIDPSNGVKLCFDLFYDQIPSIAWSFFRLLTKDVTGCLKKRISIGRNSNEYIADSDWREEIEGTTPRNGEGLMLYTNTTNSFEITNKDYTTGHFFGKLINEDELYFTVNETKGLVIYDSGNYF